MNKDIERLTLLSGRIYGMDPCIFCKIVASEAPAVVVYEDPEVVAFLDKEPFNMGHTLVVPRRHYRYITDMPEVEVGELYKAVSRVARAVYRATGADGLNIGQSNGEAASQQIFHVHVHIIPRFKVEARGPSPSFFPPRRKVDIRELEETGRAIRLELARLESQSEVWVRP